MTLYPGRHCKYFCRKLNLKDMRQRLIVILILLLWCLNLGAQAPSIILKGKLVEKGTGMPDSYATIRFYSNIQKKNVAYNVAAEDGTFEQKINSIGSIHLYMKMSAENNYLFHLRSLKEWMFTTLES